MCPMIQKPRFPHDCSECRFLGTVDGGDPYRGSQFMRFDLYYCASTDDGSLLARYGDEGGEYLSSPRALLERESGAHPALRWALSLVHREERDI